MAALVAGPRAPVAAVVVMPGLIALLSTLAWLATCRRQAAITVAAEAFVILRSGRGDESGREDRSGLVNRTGDAGRVG